MLLHDIWGYRLDTGTGCVGRSSIGSDEDIAFLKMVDIDKERVVKEVNLALSLLLAHIIDISIMFRKRGKVIK